MASDDPRARTASRAQAAAAAAGGGGGGAERFDSGRNPGSMLEDPSLRKYIAWSEDGKSFLVFNPSEFAREVLPRYFKHSNFSSFLRQCNFYNWSKCVYLAPPPAVQARVDRLAAAQGQRRLELLKPLHQPRRLARPSLGVPQPVLPARPSGPPRAHQAQDGQVQRRKQSRRRKTTRIRLCQRRCRCCAVSCVEARSGRIGGWSGGCGAGVAGGTDG
ncbi:HSF-type DNA-binding-domain containing protein [Rhodotorula toruloides]|uniref:HSF-type DNA-binding-domain containing protein n=1 Tax=Rhodotorula toruloides TaxID=5286 RepID=A0A2T0A079_RHOTO|nr:HSF-type DNA-binding-domain containing protein [Rhodotorula toruloides]